MKFKIIDWHGKTHAPDGFPATRVVFETENWSEAWHVYDVITRNFKQDDFFKVEITTEPSKKYFEDDSEESIIKWYNSLLPTQNKKQDFYEVKK